MAETIKNTEPYTVCLLIPFKSEKYLKMTVDAVSFVDFKGNDIGFEVEAQREGTVSLQNAKCAKKDYPALYIEGYLYHDHYENPFTADETMNFGAHSYRELHLQMYDNSKEEEVIVESSRLAFK